MGDAIDGGFGKFVPGFDFLQNLAKGASQSIPQIPNLANWVSPSLNVEDLQKRIEELRAVQFWLEQNSRALAATIQALEVQKMTLATLKGMNFNIGDMANVFNPKADDAAPAGVQMAAEPMSSSAKTVPDAPPEVRAAASKRATKAKPGSAASSVIDPLNLWSALTQQFQQIAASAMQGAAHPSAGDTTSGGGAAVTRQAAKKGKKAASGGRQGAAKSASRGNKAERRSTR